MKNINVLLRFSKARRAAVAVTMAIALVPLVLLIGIAIDVTFLSQDRLQTAFAAEAAAASATRIAAATYSLEAINNEPAPTSETATAAAQLAIEAADVVGSLWFDANLGNYSIGTLNSRSTSTTFDGNTDGSASVTTPPNFTAVVTTNSSYPPLFNTLFQHPNSQQWVYSSGGSATTTFAYVQFLLMLDTSSSMLIGADSPANNPNGTEDDVLPMEQGTVCPANGTAGPKNGNVPLVDGTFALNKTGLGTQPPLDPTQPQGQNYLYNVTDSDNANLAQTDTPPTANYPGKSDTDVSEKCTGTRTGYGNNQNIAGTPCSLACHYSTTISPVTGYTEDYYGLARHEGVKLRLDVLFTATEQVIQDLISTEAVANQFAVGVYQFNTDVWPIVNASLGGGGQLPEAATNLSEALNLVEQDDWQKNPGETAIPQVINVNNNGAYTAPSATGATTGGDTNFPLSLNDLEYGNNNVWPQSKGKNQPLTASGQGDTISTPEKFLFIVTDGMEDDSPNNGSSSTQNVEGEMTSFTQEKSVAGKTTTVPGAVCSYLKNVLGYTVYVLYVDYEPVSNFSYYGYGGSARPPDTYVTDDYGTTYGTNTSVQQLTAVQNVNAAPTFGTAPIALALQACASAPGDFLEASNDQSIEQDLTTLLKSALASTIRMTN